VVRLDPTLDIVFKLLLLRERALLVDMIQCILRRPVHGLAVLDRDLHGEHARDKRVAFDIRVALHDGTRIDLEMQARERPALAARLVFYGARDYASQLRNGDDYRRLTPTIVIAWLVEPLFPRGAFHYHFRLYDPDTRTQLGDPLSVHVLQLSAPVPSPPRGSTSSPLSSAHATRYDVQAQRWARFLTARSDAALDQLASEDPIMSLAKQTLDALSEDPVVRRLAQEREDAIKLYEIDLAVGRAQAAAEGRAEGRAEGVAQTVLKLLGLRFGPLPAATQARVEAATREQLDAWAERVLTARTLDEVLAP
jgi:predicted transposase/invertase (TIGR01784 family)